MKLLPILLVLTIIVSPVIYGYIKTHYYPYQLMRDFKREAIPKSIVNLILKKMGKSAQVSELRNIKKINFFWVIPFSMSCSI